MSDAPLHIFVDEAGDTTLFGRHGKVLIGEEGTSRFFIVGRLEVDDTKALTEDLDRLRAELLAAPLLQGVPSMDPKRGKTARFFHAKDDLPKVRGKPHRTGVTFNEEHPLTLESRAGAGNEDREILGEPNHHTARGRLLSLDEAILA